MGDHSTVWEYCCGGLYCLIRGLWLSFTYIPKYLGHSARFMTEKNTAFPVLGLCFCGRVPEENLVTNAYLEMSCPLYYKYERLIIAHTVT